MSAAGREVMRMICTERIKKLLPLYGVKCHLFEDHKNGISCAEYNKLEEMFKEKEKRK